MFLLKNAVKNPTNKNTITFMISPPTTHINKLINDTTKMIYNNGLLYNRSVFNKELRETFSAALLYKFAKADFIVFDDFVIIYII